MAESNSKLSKPLQKFATDLKAMLQKTETQIREMRAREVSTKERKLEKHELCPLCGGPDVNGRCKCIAALQKNADAGYGPGAEDGGAGGGGGGEPMGMSEMKKDDTVGALAKCGSCGGVGKHMDKCDLSEVTKGKDLSKAALTSHAQSSMGAPAPKPATPVGQVNHEMGGFKSLTGAHPAVGGGGGGIAGLPATRKPVHAMGRPTMSVSGSIPNAKAEMGAGDKRYGGPGHASQKNMPSALKENMAPTAKAEIPATKVAPEAAVKGAKAPKPGKDATPAKQGSGGEIKKGAKLSKAMPAPAPGKAPAGKGVGGKQPVGQGGGDAHKVAAPAKGGAPAPAPKPGLAKLKAAGTAEVGRQKGVANVQRLKGDLANVQAQKDKAAGMDLHSLAAGAKAGAAKPAAKPPLPSVDVDVSDLAGPTSMSKLGPAGAPAGNPGALKAATRPGTVNDVRGQMNDAANLAADKKAGGVGFLRGLFSMFHQPKQSLAQAGALAPKWQQQGQLTSQRFNGARPLQRSEKAPMDMKKAALSLTKKDLENDGFGKEEMPAPTEGLSSINHNRRMLSVKPGSPRRKKNR